jgi:hypothetical protein
MVIAAAFTPSHTVPLIRAISAADNNSAGGVAEDRSLLAGRSTACRLVRIGHPGIPAV